MKHTEGEWKVVKSKSKPAFNVVGTRLAGKYKIARCPYTLLSDGSSVDQEEAEANAKLAAASPNMYEALRKLNRSEDWNRLSDENQKQILTALRKAVE